MLWWLIMGPISHLAGVADCVSTGDFDGAEFPASRDEIGVLAASVKRRRRSLYKAIQLINA